MSFENLPATQEFRDSNTYKHAILELDLVLSYEDEYDRMAGQAVLDLLKVFYDQGHSGFSASCVRQIFNKLSNFDPLGPLTGADCEWDDCGDGLQQNKRSSNVFRDKDGTAYQSDYYIFRDPDGCSYTGRGSRRVITEWPYTPGREYIQK